MSDVHALDKWKSTSSYKAAALEANKRVNCRKPIKMTQNHNKIAIEFNADQNLFLRHNYESLHIKQSYSSVMIFTVQLYIVVTF